MGLYDFTNSTDPNRIITRLRRLETMAPRLHGGVLQTTSSGLTTVVDPSTGPNLPVSRTPHTRIRVVQRP